MATNKSEWQQTIDDIFAGKRAIDEIASTENYGRVKLDGVTIVTDADGRIKVADDFVGSGGDITLEDASLTTKGVAQLSNAIDSIEEDKSATPLAVSTALTESKTYTDTEITKLSTSSEAKYAKIVHKHEISDINDLQEELDKKALKTDVNNLKSNFDSHVHEISQVNNLQSSLDQKAPLTHVHNWTEIFGRPTTSPAQIDKLAEDSHTHPNMNVINNLEDGNGILIYNGNPLGETAYLSVQNIAERDAIPMEARKEGLMVLVLEDGGMYYLKNGTDNAFWKIFSQSSDIASNAFGLSATPSGNLTGNNVQSLIDELESTKVNKTDVYSKSETENFMKGYVIDYSTLDNLPDLSTLHGHENKETLDLFSQYQGNLTWKGKTLGDLVSEAYDANFDGIIDVAQKLEGVNATAEEINALTGVTGNIQQMISSLSSGVTFRGTYASYEEMTLALVSPKKGDLVYIEVDETKDSALDTQYVYDGVDFVYGGGTTKTPDATSTTKGVIQLGGDLAGIGSSASAPKLSPTGVTSGLYRNPLLTISEDGRITNATEGDSVFLNDTVVNEFEGWTSKKINDELAKKSDRNHTHAQLHDKNDIGAVKVKEEIPNDMTILTYNQVSGQAEFLPNQGTKVMVGTKFLQGDYSLVAGSYITLGIDEINRQIVINSTYRDGSGANLPTAFEILFSKVVQPNSTERFSVPATYNKVMLHTVQSYASNDSTHEIRLYNQAEGGWIEYNSNAELQVSDIVNVPIIDNDNSKMIHVEIQNYSIEEATFSCRLKCSNLL